MNECVSMCLCVWLLVTNFTSFFQDQTFQIQKKRWGFFFSVHVALEKLYTHRYSRRNQNHDWWENRSLLYALGKLLKNVLFIFPFFLATIRKRKKNDFKSLFVSQSVIIHTHTCTHKRTKTPWWCLFDSAECKKNKWMSKDKKYNGLNHCHNESNGINKFLMWKRWR